MSTGNINFVSRLLGGALLLFVYASGVAGSNPAEWRWGIAAGPSEKHLKICLYRDSESAGLFSKGDWKARVGEAEPGQCEERMEADLDSRILYLSIPGFKRQHGYMAGRADAYCLPNEPRDRYSPCTSNFFTVSSVGPNYRSLSAKRIRSITDEAGLVALLEEQIVIRKNEHTQALRAAYLAEFEGADTLAKIEKFERDYAANDPDDLIGKLADRKVRLEHEERVKQQTEEAQTRAESAVAAREEARLEDLAERNAPQCKTVLITGPIIGERAFGYSPVNVLNEYVRSSPAQQQKMTDALPFNWQNTRFMPSCNGLLEVYDMPLDVLKMPAAMYRGREDELARLYYGVATFDLTNGGVGQCLVFALKEYASSCM